MQPTLRLLSPKALRVRHLRLLLTILEVEKVISESAGTYSVGDKVSMADLFLVPQVYNAVRFQVDMAQFPTIQRVYDALVVLEPFVKAAPANQPDAETS